MFSINTSTNSLLRQIPGSTDKELVMAPDEAMRAMRPVLSQHADLRAVQLFEQWVVNRQMDISMGQVAYLWVNFETFYLRELPQRITQWSCDRSLRSPFRMGIDFMRLITLRRWNPWVIRKSVTLFGRIQVKLLKVLGNTLVFVFFFWMALGVWMTLGAARQPLINGMSGLGVV